MQISCASCPVRGLRCDTCVVATFLGMPAQVEQERPARPSWEAEDHRLLDLLCSAGLVNADDAARAELTYADFTGLRTAV